MAKYHQISRVLREAVINGTLTPGQRLPSERKLARQHGVSYMTARRAVTELVEEGILERRDRDGTYIRETAWSEPRESVSLPRVPLLRVCITTAAPASATGKPALAPGTYRQRCVEAFEAAISARGGTTFFERNALPHDGESSTQSLPANANAVFVVPMRGFREAVLSRYVDLALPLVTCCYYGPLRVNRVYEDWGWAMHEVMDHLVGLGHRRIALASLRGRSRHAARWIRAREKAFLQSANGRSLPVTEMDIYHRSFCEAYDRDQESAGFAMGRRLFEETAPYTAVVGVNDRVALGVMRAAAACGVRVPEDISVTGFDNLPIDMDYGLTTIKPAAEQDGRDAAQLIIDTFQNACPGRAVQLTNRPEMIVRRTTATPRSSEPEALESLCNASASNRPFHTTTKESPR
mgnify:CR=1 FL=1